jgi:hypothetical protein
VTQPASTLSDDERTMILRLGQRHDAEILELETYDRYYEGTQPLTYMHPEILREVADRIRPVIIFWPQMVVDSVEERLRLEGFKTGNRKLDAELWRVWRASKMQLGFRQNTVDSLVMRRSYVCVGSNADDKKTPIITPESPLELYADEDPRTRQVRSALRRVNDITPDGLTLARYATLYQPHQTIWCEWEGDWKVTQRDVHNLGRVPVVPVVNRQRLRSTTRTFKNLTIERIGRSDLDAVMPLSDSANKMATDMMVAGEFVAVPLRALFGVAPDEFTDQDGNKVSALTAMMGRALAIPGEQVKAFEFAAAQLGNFTTALTSLSQLVAAISGLPPHYLGMASDNPASAEAIEGSEARLATRAERKQDSLGVAAVCVAELVNRIQTGDWDPDVAVAAPDWRDVRTPTVAAMADAAVKKYQAKIVPLRQTREDLQYTEQQIEDMEAEDDKAAENNPAVKIANAMNVGAATPYPAPPAVPGAGS